MIVPEGSGLGEDIAGRLPFRTVLKELRPYLPNVDRDATPAAVAFVVLDRAVADHEAALDQLDRTERRSIAAGTAVGDFGPGERLGNVGATDRPKRPGGAVETPWDARTGSGPSIWPRISLEGVRRPRGAGAPPPRMGRGSD